MTLEQHEALQESHSSVCSVISPLLLQMTSNAPQLNTRLQSLTVSLTTAASQADLFAEKVTSYSDHVMKHTYLECNTQDARQARELGDLKQQLTRQEASTSAHINVSGEM